MLQGAEILSQSSRLDADDEAGSDDDKSLPDDSDSNDVCHMTSHALFICFIFTVV